MSVFFNFCFSGDPTPQAVEVPHESSWETLAAAVCASTGMPSISYFELYEGSTLVGERVMDMDEFWNLCNYYTEAMVFVAFGQSPAYFVAPQPDEQSADIGLVHDANYESKLSSLLGDSDVHDSTIHDVSTPHEQSHIQDTGSNSLDSGESHGHQRGVRSHPSCDGYDNLNNSSYSNNDKPQHDDVVDMSRYTAAAVQQREQEIEGDNFSASLASLMSGLSALTASTPTTLALNQSIIYDTTAQVNSSSMANLKTSAEIEMEMLQEEEENRRRLAEEEARRVQLEKERVEKAQREEEERIAYEAMALAEKLEKEEAERLLIEEEAARVAAEKKRLRTENMAKQRLLAQEERRRELLLKREKEAETRAGAKTLSNKTSNGKYKDNVEGDATISSLGSGSVSDDNDDVNDDGESDDDEMWSRSAEHNARKRALQVEKKKRVDTLSAQRRSDRKDEKTVFQSSTDDKKIPVMGNNRLKAINSQREMVVKIYFKSIFSDDNTQDNGLVCINMPEECDWIDLTTTVGITLDLIPDDEIKQFVLLDDDGEETSGAITDAQKFWKFYKRRYDFAKKMSFLVFHSNKPEPKKFMKSPPTKKVNQKVSKSPAKPSQQMGAIKKLSEKAFPPVALFRLTTDYIDDRTEVQLPPDLDSWDTLTTSLVETFNQPASFIIKRLALFDEDGDELSVINDIGDFRKIICGRYNSDAHVLVVDFEKSSVKSKAATTGKSSAGHNQYALKGGQNDDAVTKAVFCQLEKSNSDRLSVDVPVDGDWIVVCKCFYQVFGFQPDSTITSMRLVDDDGDEVFSGIKTDRQFWKAVNNRYDSEVMTFVISIEGSALSEAVQTVSLLFDVTKGNGRNKVEVEIPLGSSWDEISQVLFNFFDFEASSKVTRIDLIDEDGDDVLGAITNEKKFWKAVNNRYNSDDMVFIAAIEAGVIVAPVSKVPCTSLNFRLSSDTIDRKDCINVPLNRCWDDVVASILEYYNFDIPCAVTQIDLVDEDGDDVLGGITNDKRFWKAVNSRYNSVDMVFVVSVEAVVNVLPPIAADVPCTSLKFKLSSDPIDRKDFINVPVDGNWDDVVGAILAYYNFDIPCIVTRVDLVDEDGDDVLSGITNEKKFWKAVNNRYNSTEMVFVVSVEAVVSEQEVVQVAIPDVPSTSLLFKLSTDVASNGKDNISVPVDGNWDDVTSSILAYYNFDIPCIVTRVDLVDEDGDNVLGGISNEKKFWKAVNNRYNGSEMVFIVFVEAIVNEEEIPPSDLTIPRISLNFRLSIDQNERRDIIDVQVDGSWDDIVASVLDYYCFEVPTAISRIDLVDEDGDDVFGSIVNDRKFWKAVNNRYNSTEMVFVVTVESTSCHDSVSDATTTQELESVNSKFSSNYGMPCQDAYVEEPLQKGTTSGRRNNSNLKNSAETSPSVSKPIDSGKSEYEGVVVQIAFKLPLDPVAKAVLTNIPAMGEWDDVCESIKEAFEFSPKTAIDYVELIDEDGDTIQSSVKNTSKFWKACIDLYKEGFSVFNIHLAKAERRGVLVTGSIVGAKETSKSDRRLSRNLKSNDSMDQSDHTTASNLSTSGHNSMNTSSHKGGNISVSDFLRSCCSGDLEFVSNALQKGFDINSKDDVGLTGLHVASIQGQPKMIELLLDKGAAISCRDVDGMTPLHFACENNHVQIAIALSRGGGDTSLRNKVGLTALHYICMNGLLPLTVLIRDYMINVSTSAGLTLLHCAADMGHLEMVSYLVEHDAQIMPRDDDGMTPLHLACMGGHIDCVEYLIEEGSYWNTRDDEGMSPFLMAAKEGNVELASLLIDIGANVHVRNDVGNTAMHLACESGSMDMSKFLLDGARVDINARNQGMETPLIIAMKCGHDNLVGWLQERGATMKSESREEAEMRHQIDTKAEAAARAFESEEEISFEQDRNDRRAKSRGSNRR